MNFLEADKDDTGTTVGSLVQFNTVISFLPIGMLLLSLFVLSIRLEKDLSIAVLQRRLTLLRVALALGSTFLVVGVLAQKILMEWPLSLILESQTVGLRQLASALTLQVGAQGTIALLAAFGPAIAAWYLDAAALRHKSVDVLPSHPRDSADAQAGNAIVVAPLAFAPLSAIASFFAVLAPLLASPVADAIKSLLLIFTKGSP